MSAMKVLLRCSRCLLFCAVVMLGLLLVGTTGCKKSAGQTQPVTASNDDPNQVTVTPAIAANLKLGHPEMHDVTGSLEVTARVQTDASRIARVGSPVAGRILKLLVMEGEHVRAGAVLAMLHSTALSDAQLSLVKAHSEEVLAEASTKRAERLLAADVIGQAELERRRAELLQANAELASYRTQLRGLGMTDAQIEHVESTHRLSADYPIVAPRAGTVLERKIAIGQVVQPADPAFTIADLSNVWVVANVPEEDAGQLREGMEVEVRIPAIPGANVAGHLSFVSPIVDPATRTVEVRMELPNPQGVYKPDELASMTFTGHKTRKLTVPNTALFRQDNKDYLFVQTMPHQFVMREVVLGEESDDRRVVISGVAADEPIVTDGAFHLNNQRKQNAITGGE